MTDLSSVVTSIDHVELFVPDRESARDWYAQALGFKPVSGTEAWAADPQGPLMISADGGHSKLALFKGEPQGARATSGWHRVAFRLDASAFLSFLERARILGLCESDGTTRVRDHTTAISVYFDDPYGHHLEVTTYDHAAVRVALNTSG